MEAETPESRTTPYSPVRVHVQLVEGQDLNRDGAGQTHILVTPHPFRVKAGHPLIFESDRPFAVEFVGTAPLQGDLVDLNQDPRPAWTEALGDWRCHPYCYGQLTREDAARVKTYKYTVSVVDHREGAPDRVYIADPEGVLDPDPIKAA